MIPLRTKFCGVFLRISGLSAFEVVVGDAWTFRVVSLVFEYYLDEDHLCLVVVLFKKGAMTVVLMGSGAADGTRGSLEIQELSELRQFLEPYYFGSDKSHQCCIDSCLESNTGAFDHAQLSSSKFFLRRKNVEIPVVPATPLTLGFDLATIRAWSSIRGFHRRPNPEIH